MNMLVDSVSVEKKIHGGNDGHRRPKLLFLAHRFPPAGTIASVRTWNIAKYLSRSGWDVTVVTPDPSVWRHIDNSAKADSDLEREGIRRILTGHDRRFLIPYLLNCRNDGIGWFTGGVCRIVARRLGIDIGVGWIRAAEKACAGLAVKDVDVILASGPPFSAFALARQLSDRLGRPYILDYRDPWTDGELGSHRRAVHRYEGKLLARCAAAITVSDSKASALDRDFRVGSKLHVVTNGYDDEELANVEPFKFGHFAIVYAGSFYPPIRTISPIMAVLKRLPRLANNDNEIYFHYYGDQEGHVRNEADRFGVSDRVVIHGRVPRAEALAASRGADIAVVISSVFDEAPLKDKGIVPGKIFELIGLRTPILLLAPPESDIEEILGKTNLGRAFKGSDHEGIAAFILDKILGRKMGVKDTGEYSWNRIGKKFDVVLRSVLEKKPNKR